MTIDWANFTWQSASTGGMLIGMAAAMLLLLNGRVAGVSGIIGGLMSRASREAEFSWRAAFIAGLALAPTTYVLVATMPPIQVDASVPALIVAGLLVGVGTRYGSGCTSGHGVCGMARLSPRAVVATLCFMAGGFLTVFVVRHLLGI
jgi:uncharacterized protein